ncbi:MAG TPA: hypothetical protein H9693_04740 [Firmicutes bacterium]|nr:hypothetical protein [Bacillota bacterium]
MGKIKDKLAAAFERVRSVRHIEIIIAVIAVTIMLFIYFGTSCSSSSDSGIQSGSGEYDYCESVVAELERKLSEIDGVGEVSVLVNWTDSVSADGSESSFPKPEGVIIICDGGNDISVKLKLISSVASYFGISENKINVLAKATIQK